MDFSIDTEQEALRDAVRGLITRAYDSSETRRKITATDPGFGEDTWRKLAEMGLLGLPFDESVGGMGAGPVEVALVAEELGRVIAPEPFIESVVFAGGLIDALGDDAQKQQYLTPLTEGESVLAVAWLEPGSRWSTTATGSVKATCTGDSWTLTGVKEPVLHGGRADTLVVSAATGDGTALFLVTADAAGLTRTSYRTHDGGRAATVEFAETPAVPLGDPATDQSGVLAEQLDRARIAYGHEALGAMATALETTVGYLLTRKQFGVTLNTFQALKFRAADLYVALELAGSTITWATMVAADEHTTADQISAAAAQSALQVSVAGRLIGQDAIQLHGGIGMTAEYSVGHLTSRLTAIEHAIGDGGFHRARLAAQLTDHSFLEPMP